METYCNGCHHLWTVPFAMKYTTPSQVLELQLQYTLTHSQVYRSNCIILCPTHSICDYYYNIGSECILLTCSYILFVCIKSVFYKLPHFCYTEPKHKAINSPALKFGDYCDGEHYPYHGLMVIHYHNNEIKKESAMVPTMN